jgi:hypothetical protein
LHGRLAGGVAHDFNNVLTIIMSRLDLARELVGAEGDLAGHVEMIDQAVQWAVAVTRQLLALGRRQVFQPRALSLNAVTRGMQVMLQLLGQGRGRGERRPPSPHRRGRSPGGLAGKPRVLMH